MNYSINFKTESLKFLKKQSKKQQLRIKQAIDKLPNGDIKKLVSLKSRKSISFTSSAVIELFFLLMNLKNLLLLFSSIIVAISIKKYNFFLYLFQIIKLIFIYNFPMFFINTIFFNNTSYRRKWVNICILSYYSSRIQHTSTTNFYIVSKHCTKFF